MVVNDEFEKMAVATLQVVARRDSGKSRNA
jgi:hypothetical protein